MEAASHAQMEAVAVLGPVRAYLKWIAAAMEAHEDKLVETFTRE